MPCIIYLWNMLQLAVQYHRSGKEMMRWVKVEGRVSINVQAIQEVTLSETRLNSVMCSGNLYSNKQIRSVVWVSLFYLYFGVGIQFVPCNYLLSISTKFQVTSAKYFCYSIYMSTKYFSVIPLLVSSADFFCICPHICPQKM